MRYFTRWLRRMYDWVISWSRHPHAKSGLFGISFIESSFFPIPPDPLLIAMGVGRPRKALTFALITLIGSVLGGMFGYWIGQEFWSITSDWFFSWVPGFTPRLFDKVATMYRENAFLAVFTAGFTPIPYKVFTLAAGVAQISFYEFVLASIVGRGLRFFLVGGSLFFFGVKVESFINRHFDRLALAFTALGIGGFVVLKAVF